MMDDGLYVVHNTHVAAGLTASGFGWAFTTTLLGNWHPLTWISLMADSQILGTGAAGYHATNVALHLLNVLLVFFLLRRLTGSNGRSALVAGLFAAHPLRVESVAWISERKDVLSTFFWLIGIWAYARWREKPGYGRYLAIVTAFVAGLLVKPMLVTFPLTLLLIDIWPLGRIPGGGRGPRAIAGLVRDKLPLFLITVVFSAVTFLAQQSTNAVAALDVAPVSLRLANAVHSYVAYLGKTIWPANLGLFYSYPAAMPPVWETAFYLTLLGGITAFAIWSFRRRPYITAGWFWYAVTLVPVIGLVQVGSQALADRYTYVPLLGIFVLAVWGVSDLLAAVRWRLWSWAPAAIGCCLVVTLGAASYAQTRFWKDDLTAWERAAAVTHPSFFSEYNLSLAYVNRGRNDEATAHLRNAIRLDPNRVEAYNNLGVLLTGQGRYGEAESVLRVGLSINPQHALTASNLGVLLGKRERWDESFRYHNQAMALDAENPDIPASYASSHCDYGISFATKGKFQEAVAEFQLANSIDPGYWQAYYNLAQAYEALNMPDGAKKAYEKTLSIEPSCAEAHNNLGILLAESGDTGAATAHFQAAVRYKPGYQDAEQNLRIVAGEGRQ